MTFAEFFRWVEGFHNREEMHWKMVYAICACSPNFKSGTSYERFRGREQAEPLDEREKFEQLWRLIQKDRAGNMRVTEMRRGK